MYPNITLQLSRATMVEVHLMLNEIHRRDAMQSSGQDADQEVEEEVNILQLLFGHEVTTEVFIKARVAQITCPE